MEEEGQPGQLGPKVRAFPGFSCPWGLGEKMVGRDEKQCSACLQNSRVRARLSAIIVPML